MLDGGLLYFGDVAARGVSVCRQGRGGDDHHVLGGDLHQLRAALLRAGGGGVARVHAAAAGARRLHAPRALGVRAAGAAVPAHL